MRNYNSLLRCLKVWLLVALCVTARFAFAADHQIRVEAEAPALDSKADAAANIDAFIARLTTIGESIREPLRDKTGKRLFETEKRVQEQQAALYRQTGKDIVELLNKLSDAKREEKSIEALEALMEYQYVELKAPELEKFLKQRKDYDLLRNSIHVVTSLEGTEPSRWVKPNMAEARSFQKKAEAMLKDHRYEILDAKNHPYFPTLKKRFNAQVERLCDLQIYVGTEEKTEAAIPACSDKSKLLVQ